MEASNINSAEATIQNKPKIKFLYIEHTPEKFDQIINDLNNADVIFLEFIANVETKSIIQKIANKVAQFGSAKDKEYYLKNLAGPSGYEDFTLLTLRHSILNNKQIFFIDESDGDPGIKLNEQANKHLELSIENLKEGRAADAYQHFVEYHYDGAKSTKIRNDRVKEQVLTLINLGEIKGKNICVIQGDYHRATYIDIKKNIDDVDTSRSFENPSMIFDIGNEIENRIITNKIDTIDTLIKRDFMRRFIIPIQNDKSPFGIPQVEAEKFMRSIPDQAIEDCFEKIMDLQNIDQGNGAEYQKEYSLKKMFLLGFQVFEKYYKK